MAVLKDGQFELDGFVFGGTSPSGLFVSNYKLEASSWRGESAPDPVGNRTLFGRDYLDGPNWNFEMHTMTGDEVSALDLLERAALIFEPEEKYKIPGAESILRYARGGRTRRVYGRARKFDYDTNGFIRQGSFDASASFQTSDSIFYDDVQRSAVMEFTASQDLGITFPNVFPWAKTKSSLKTKIIDDVGGTIPCPVTIVVEGPIADFTISGDDWKLTLMTSLAAGEKVTIDTRKKTVLKNNGASLAGTLTRDSRLRSVKLKPGSDKFYFRGVDITGSARCVVYWRPAYKGL